jgi:phage terminase large subunit-like protein
MGIELTRREMKLLSRTSREEKERIIGNMTVADALDFDADFESWAHEAQLPPNDDGWRTWLMMAGRGFGKTRAGAEWIEKIARSRPGVRIALVGATIDEARRVMVEGISGVLSVAKRRRHKVRWEPTLGRLKWPNGSEAQIYSGDNPDGLRGPEHDFAWGIAAAGCYCGRSSRGIAVE